MLRRLALFLIIAPIVAVASYPLFSEPGSASPGVHLEQGEFWRLPWVSGNSMQVSGYGYNDTGYNNEGSSHWGTSAYALDLGVKGGSIEGRYVMAVQEGTVVAAVGSHLPSYCCPTCGAGNYVEITDAGGFVSHYAHLSEVFKNVNEYIEPGWVIGKAGHTGYTDDGQP